jgi:hypothetical protein
MSVCPDCSWITGLHKNNSHRVSISEIVLAQRWRAGSFLPLEIPVRKSSHCCGVAWTSVSGGSSLRYPNSTCRGPWRCSPARTSSRRFSRIRSDLVHPSALSYAAGAGRRPHRRVPAESAPYPRRLTLRERSPMACRLTALTLATVSRRGFP